MQTDRGRCCVRAIPKRRALLKTTCEDEHMSESGNVDVETATADNERPEFRGCVFCYSAEWAAYAGKKGYRALSK
jgi:hypothetical protein